MSSLETDGIFERPVVAADRCDPLLPLLARGALRTQLVNPESRHLALDPVAVAELRIGELHAAVQRAGVNLLLDVVDGILERLEFAHALDDAGHILRITLDHPAARLTAGVDHAAVQETVLPVEPDAELHVIARELAPGEQPQHLRPVGGMDGRKHHFAPAANRLRVSDARKPPDQTRRFDLVALLVIVPMVERLDLLGHFHAAIGLFELVFGLLLLRHVAAHAEGVLLVELENPVFVVAGHPVERDVVVGGGTLARRVHPVEVIFDARHRPPPRASCRCPAR